MHASWPMNGWPKRVEDRRWTCSAVVCRFAEGCGGFRSKKESGLADREISVTGFWENAGLLGDDGDLYAFAAVGAGAA